MRVTTWAEYSLILTVNLAQRRTSGLVAISARELAEAERLPVDYVEQILLRLRRAGIVESQRGAKGGYRLARNPAELTVQAIMSASDREVFEMNCETHQVDPARCSPSNACSIRPVWYALQQRVNQLLESVTLADLIKQEPEVQQLVGLSAAS